MDFRNTDMAVSTGRAVPPRFLSDAADRDSDAIVDDARVTREAPDAVQANLALKNLEGHGWRVFIYLFTINTHTIYILLFYFIYIFIYLMAASKFEKTSAQ